MLIDLKKSETVIMREQLSVSTDGLYISLSIVLGCALFLHFLGYMISLPLLFRYLNVRMSETVNILFLFVCFLGGGA